MLSMSSIPKYNSKHDLFFEMHRVSKSVTFCDCNSPILKSDSYAQICHRLDQVLERQQNVLFISNNFDSKSKM